MLIPVNQTVTLMTSFGRTRTGRDAYYKVLYSNGSTKTDWTSAGVVELGFGMYGVSTSIDEIMSGFIQWKAELSGASTLYAGESINITEDYLDSIDKIFKVETGRWKILNNQMIFYDTDGTTPIYTFNLKDSSGSPTETNPYEREIA